MAAFQGALWSIYATMLCVISSVLIASGELIPDEPRVCTNTSLTFTCSDPGNASALQLLVFMVDFVMIPESELDRGESNVSYTIPRISTADTNANVFCGYVNESLEYYEDIGMAFVTVYSYPKDLEEIHCEVDDYDKAMTCTWKWGQEYFGKNTPEVTCQFRAPELSASWTICNATKKGKGVTLQINSTRQGDFSLKKMEFNMTLESQCDISTSKVFPIDTNNIVRPAPAYNLTTAVLNSSCIEFHWHHRSPHHNKTHRITVTSKWNDTQVKELNATHDTVSRINHTICDLHPSTTYSGSIEMMPIVGGYWSDESQVKGTTKEDRPSASPEVIGYTWDPLECDKGTHRRVRVFWKPVPEIDKNGEMIFYNVTLWPKGKAKIMNVDGIAASFYSVNLLGILCDMSYSVTVVAYTSIGGSPHNSSFIVLRHSTIERPHFMVESVSNNSSESGTNTVDVVILGDSVEQMTKSRAHYMICWCEKDRGSCKRMSVLQCVPSQMKTTSLQLADPENKMYAVAMVTKAGDISSLALESCIYPKNIAPTVSPNSVKASPGSEDNTINVIWDKLTCQSWQPFIAFYVVQYCTVVKEGINSCKGTVDSVEVPEKDYSYMLTDLKEDEVYRIVVRGMTRDGKSTPDSEPAFAQAINKTLKPSVILGIAFGCVVALAFAIAGFVCTVRKCNYRRIEFLRSKREIVDLPISGPIEQNDITLESYTRYSDPANVIHDENHAQDKGLDNNGYLVPSDRNIPINEEA
ncbi:interleukin-6 receptor subunit beta-like isoform X2 [Mya arenaria]|uniref:interleukin-6 receptor subunit beta-like isoform X2 n=1 Tax=Mya arenaria TaxID=6604 RepID=UPI0022E808F7|nr:interleukin-6 receptor subunit beta-like isoform X2 [Mya arenaria]